MMSNKIDRIKRAIIDAFPNADGVAIILNDEIMDIRIIPCKTSEEEEIEQIIVEGRKKWKSTGL